MPTNPNLFSSRLALSCLIALLVFSASCNRSARTQPKRYSLIGTVISVDKNAGTANIDNQPIKGFMEKMVMPYSIRPA